MNEIVSDVVVIGGGVAGLAAAGEMARHGQSVTLVEARERLGGRVYTVRPPGWKQPVELGPQFVHGGNDPFWDLLKKNRLPTPAVPARHWYAREGEFRKLDATEGIAAVTEKIDEKTMQGWSFAKFMRQAAGDVSDVDRELALGFVEGFEAAPADQMSAVAVAGETLEDDEQYYLPRGYDAVVDALVARLARDNVRVFLDAPCTAVEWGKGRVSVRSRGARFVARAAVVTVPLGVLQTRTGRGAISFSPSLGAHSRIIARMGMGTVIRVTLRFDARRWQRLLPEPLAAKAGRGFGFIHSPGEKIPVWWSLTGDPVVTAWSGGTNAIALARGSEAQIVRRAIDGLARLFQQSPSVVREAMRGAATHNWARDPFSRGAYSFTKAGADDAAERLREPLRDTLFFAGEATAEGEEVGTVHGAMGSGLRAARQVRSAR